MNEETGFGQPGHRLLGSTGCPCLRGGTPLRLFLPALLLAGRAGRADRRFSGVRDRGSGHRIYRGVGPAHGGPATGADAQDLLPGERAVREPRRRHRQERGHHRCPRAGGQRAGAYRERGVLDGSLGLSGAGHRGGGPGTGPRHGRRHGPCRGRWHRGRREVVNVGIILLGVLALVVFLVAARSVRIIPQSRVAIVQRLGRYHRTAQSGLTFVVPVVDRMLPKTDLREQVIAFQPQAVITNDNVGMQISTVVYYQVVDARASEYEVANFHLALEQITQTTLRNVIGNLILDKTLTSRDEINAKLRTVLDEVTEKWGIRVTRVELKEIIPPRDIQQAMEKQMQAERTRRAAILTAEGDKRAAILKSEGEKASSILRAEGEAEAYRNVQAAQIEMTGKLFERLESSDLSPESLRYLYLKALPEMAQGPASKLFVVPSEIQDLAGTLGALAGGASLATEDNQKGEKEQRRLDAPAGRPNGELPARR